MNIDGDKTIYICKQCNSHNILHDAWAQWNSDTNAFELASVYEDKKCGDCDAKYKYLEPTIIPVQ